MKKLTLILCFIIGQSLVAQVGIGNTNPQSKLDISASNVTAPANTDGILIPRIDNFPSTNPTASQDGMMVFYTGTGASGKGFYYWNQTIGNWMFLNSNGQNTLDEAYDEGGVGAGRTITVDNGPVRLIGGEESLEITSNLTNDNDEAFRLSAIVTGDRSVGLRLDYSGANLIASPSIGEAISLSNRIEYDIASGYVNGLKNTILLGTNTGTLLNTGYRGIFNNFYSINNPNGSNIGMTNEFHFFANRQVGVENVFRSDSNTAYGLWNRTQLGPETELKGVFNELVNNSSSEDTYGIHTTITGTSNGNKYGGNTYIPTSSSGTHYGTYNDVRSASGYAAYLIGRTSLGTGTSNRYLMPATAGTNNQIMAINGSGQVNFVDASSILTNTDQQTIDNFSFNSGTNELTLEIENDGIPAQTVDLSSLSDEDHDWYISSSTNTPTSINDNIYTQGNVAIGKANVAYKLDVLEDNNTASRALNINKIDNSSSFTYGIYVSKQGLGTDRSHGIYTNVTGSGTHQKYGTFNRINSSATGSQYGTRNWISGSTPSNQFGTFNNLDNNGTGDVYGVYNGMRATNSTNAFGVYNEFLTANSSTNVMAGVRNRFTNGTPGADGFSGVFTDFDLTANGTYYGIRNEYSSGSSGSGTKYGSYNLIPAGAGGNHVGVYSQATKGGSFSGYFLGRFYIGTNTTNGYVLPTTDGAANQVLSTNGAGQLVFTNATNTVNAINGLSEVGNNIQLGGALTQDTAITYANFDTRFNLNGTGDFIIQDAGTGKFTVIDNGDTVLGGDLYWRDENTGGTVLGRFIDDDNDGQLQIYENGNVSINLDANGTTIFNEQSLDRDFRIESDNSANMFYMDASTNRIGLNTNTPSSMLDLHVNSTGTVAHAELTETAANDGGRIKFNNSVEADNYWTLYGRSDNTEADARFNLYFSSIAGGGGGNIITVTGNGQVGIRDGAPTYALELPNNAAVTTGRARANAWVTYSDSRVKKHQKPLQYGLKSLLDLTPKSYVQHNSTFENNQLILDYKTGKPSIGFIAQELYKYIPEVVYKPENENKDLWSVDYERLIPITVKAIQELKEEVDTLAQKNQQLKEQLKQFKNLEARLSALENTLNPINETVEVKNSKE